MGDSERPTKRLHVESDTPLPSKSIQGSPWMTDGTIVLRAVSKTDEQVTYTLWKVHKSVLSYHCAFFRDLFGGPGDSTLLDNTSEQYDGVPVMDVQDVAEDMAQFLKAMYSPAQLQQHHYTRTSGDRVAVNATFPGMYAGILRLAHKYDAKELHGLVSLSLTQQWPSTREQWTAVHRIGYKAENHPNPVEAIALGYMYNVPDILPTAFYDLYLSHEKEGLGRPYDLSPLDSSPQLLRYYIIGRGFVNSAIDGVGQTVLASSKLKELKEECEHGRGTTCRNGLTTWYYNHVRLYKSDANFLLGGIERMIELLRANTAEGACETCQFGFSLMLAEEREKFWARLPTIFQVDGLVHEDWGAHPSHPMFPA
ncbi:unnamed protein product [Peniophora sp. CBMAI 1063]|nr:unnamed protein product [Peniophora sp. CBMAI 1063]